MKMNTLGDPAHCSHSYPTISLHFSAWPDLGITPNRLICTWGTSSGRNEPCNAFLHFLTPSNRQLPVHFLQQNASSSLLMITCLSLLLNSIQNLSWIPLIIYSLSGWFFNIASHWGKLRGVKIPARRSCTVSLYFPNKSPIVGDRQYTHTSHLY